MNFLRNNIFTRFIRNVTSSIREVAQNLTKLVGKRGMDSNGLKKANKRNVDKSKVKGEIGKDNEKDKGYIKSVDSFAPEPEPENIKPVYNYGAKDDDVNIGSGYAGLGEEASENIGSELDEAKDLWDDDKVNQKDDEFYQTKIDELSKHTKETRKSLLDFYKEVDNKKGTGEWVQEKDSIIKQVHKLIPFNDITHVPHLVQNYKEITEKLQRDIPHGLKLEFKDQVIEQEVERYLSVAKDFLNIEEKGGKFFFKDWEFGIKTLDFLVKTSNFPTILLLLTPKSIDEVVRVIRTGYLPEYLKETPFGKIGLIYERVATDMVKGTGNKEYTFPKAYSAYKKRLPMYDRLRNNGRLADVNKVLGYTYKLIDNVDVSDDVEGDAFLGLIEPQEFINEYLQFFYGRAKQTQAMSDFSFKMLKKNPEVMNRLNERGLALADKPEGTIVSVSGHIVVLVKVRNTQYNIVLNKAPSDIKSEDIDNLATMFNKESKKPKPKPKKVEPKKVESIKGLSYDYDEALKKIKNS